jgi:hypothetical protein
VSMLAQFLLSILRDSTRRIEQISRNELRRWAPPQSLAIRCGKIQMNEQLGLTDICRTVKFGSRVQVFVRWSLLLKLKSRYLTYGPEGPAQTFPSSCDSGRTPIKVFSKKK